MLDDGLRMSVSQSRALAAGIALQLGACTVLEIALVRMYTALLGQHMGLAWTAVPFLGLGLGALACVPFSGPSRPPFRIASMAHATAFSAGAASLAVVFGIRARSIDALDRASLGQLALFLGTSLLPFVLSGVALVAALSVAQKSAGVLGKRGLYGAACGVVAAAFVLPFGPARVGLGAAIALAIAAVFIARASRRMDVERPAHIGVVATFVLGCSVLLAGEIGAPYLKLAALRFSALERAEWQQWTDRGLFTADKPQAGGSVLRVDGTFGVTIVEGKQQPPVGPDELAYVLSKDKGPVLILGAGGGRELRVALRQGQKEIFAVEPERVVANEVMRGRSRTFSGEVYDKPEVRVSLEGLRSALRHPPASLRTVIVPQVDTLAAAPSGALGATPRELFTIEATRDMLAALVPEGMVSFTRPEVEIDRVVALLAAALYDTGAKAPADHVFGCSKDKLATVIAKRTPLRKEELATLRSFCRRNKLTEVVSPETPKDLPRRSLLDGADAALVSLKQGTDLRPPTDDRPYWFSTTPPGAWSKALFNVRALEENQRALLSLVVGAAVAFVLGLLALLGALATGTHGVRPKSNHGKAALGLVGASAAAALLVHALLDRLAPVLGRADLVAMVLPLAAFLGLGTGFGFGSRPKAENTHLQASTWALALLSVLAPVLMVLQPLLGAALSLPILPRLGVTSLLVFGTATPLGAVLALASRVAASRGERALSLSSAAAAAAAALGILGGTLLSMALGHSAAMLAGGACLLLAIAVLPAAKHAPGEQLVRPEPLPEDRMTPVGERVTLPELDTATEETSS